MVENQQYGERFTASHPSILRTEYTCVGLL